MRSRAWDLPKRQANRVRSNSDPISHKRLEVARPQPEEYIESPLATMPVEPKATEPEVQPAAATVDPNVMPPWMSTMTQESQMAMMTQWMAWMGMMSRHGMSPPGGPVNGMPPFMFPWGMVSTLCLIRTLTCSPLKLQLL